MIFLESSIGYLNLATFWGHYIVQSLCLLRVEKECNIRGKNHVTIL
jgi:hypothetical protein